MKRWVGENVEPVRSLTEHRSRCACVNLIIDRLWERIIDHSEPVYQTRNQLEREVIIDFLKMLHRWMKTSRKCVEAHLLSFIHYKCFLGETRKCREKRKGWNVSLPVKTWAPGWNDKNEFLFSIVFFCKYLQPCACTS